MNYLYRTLIVLFIATTPFLSIAQKDVNTLQGQTAHQHTPWCGTEYSDEQLESLEEFVEYYYHRGGKAEMAASPRATIHVPLSYHVVGNTDGSSSYGLAKVLSELCTLNSDMLHTDIQFYLKHDIDLGINNTSWNTGVATGGSTPAQLALMVPFNNDADAMNIYQVTRIRDDNGIAGFAHGSVFHNTSAPNPLQSAVFVKKGSGGSGETVAHEFGHFFSLPHTFFGWEGQNDYVCGSKAPAWAERYSGANCTTQGDRFCDTDPDYIFGGWNCSGSSNLNNGCTQMDADSATGLSDGSNIMSYAFQCSNRAFSPDQIAAMTWHLTNLRSNFINYTPTTTAITATPNLTSPDGNSPDGYDATTFTWDAVPNATHYAIEINRTPSFPDGALMVDMAIVANGTSYTSTNLAPNTNYHWRIIPYNEGNFCAAPSAKKSFTSSDFALNTNTIAGVQEIDLMPNPTHSGQSANLLIKSDKSFEAGINVYDVSGRVISSEQRVVSSGTTVHPISTIGLSAGIYIVAIQSENGVINKKLVITE